MGMAAILVMWHKIIWANFRSPIPRRLHEKFDFDWPISLWEACLSYKLTDEPSAQVT